MIRTKKICARNHTENEVVLSQPSELRGTGDGCRATSHNRIGTRRHFAPAIVGRFFFGSELDRRLVRFLRPNSIATLKKHLPINQTFLKMKIWG